MEWARLAAIRTVLLIVGGSAALIVAAFMLHPAAGWATIGVLAFFLEYMTGGGSGDQRQPGR